ncbi:MAG: BamA/OMP85 family outer membrane protein [Planctomycetota bacterium]
MLAVLMMLLSPVVTAQDTGERVEIDRVGVEGNYVVLRSDLLRSLGLRPGDRIDPMELEERVDDVNDWGGYGRVQAELVTDEDDRVTVEIELEEEVTVAELGFKGNREISDRRLEELIEVEPGDVIGVSAASQAEKAIAEAYDRKQRSLAAVTATAVFTGDQPEAVLSFGIVEGPKTHVSDIKVSGNKAFSDRWVRKTMETGQRSWPPFLWPGKFDEREFRDDINRIQNRYQDEGYLDALVSGRWNYTDDLSGVVLHIEVYEGPRYRVRRIGFSGNEIFTGRQLQQEIPLAEGEIFKPDLLDRSRDRIREMYGSQGYLQIYDPRNEGLDEELIYDPGDSKGEIDVIFKLTEGQPAYLRRIRVRGLTRTDEVVVLRNLTFRPGDRVNTNEFERSKTRLMDTGYFDRTAREPVDVRAEAPARDEEEQLEGDEQVEGDEEPQIETVEAPSEGELRDAVVEVTEGQTGSIMFGGGVSSDTGLFGQVQVRERNFDISNPPGSWRDITRGNAFRGGGQDLRLMLNVGTEESTYLLAFSDPAIANSDMSLSSRLYRHQIRWDEFDLTRTGGSVGLGWEKGRLVNREVEVGYESIDMSSVDDDTPPEIRRDDDTFAKPYLALTLGRDTRDSSQRPTEGYRADLRTEIAFADIETWKTELEGSHYWPLVETRDKGPHVFELSGELGVMDSYTDSRIPVFERFYAGGLGSVRGFRPWGISPVEPSEDEQIGGESMLIASAEYTIPVFSEDFRLAGFVDAGYVEEKAEDVFSGWEKLRVGTGVGIRWAIPVMGGLPVEVDVAFPVRRESEDNTRSVHFSLGAGTSF